MVRTIDELKQENNSYFPTNNNKEITALSLRTFNVDMIDTMFNGGSGIIPLPSNIIPSMDSGSGSIGTSILYARADHRHPSDTTKQSTLVPGTGIQIIGNTISSTVSGITPYTSTPVQSTGASGAAGTSAQYSRGDHRHPLILKTVNSQSLFGTGDIAIPAKGTNIQSISSSANSGGSSSQYAAVDHRHQLTIKTVNNQSLWGSGNINITPTGVDKTVYLRVEFSGSNPSLFTVTPIIGDIHNVSGTVVELTTTFAFSLRVTKPDGTGFIPVTLSPNQTTVGSTDYMEIPLLEPVTVRVGNGDIHYRFITSTLDPRRTYSFIIFGYDS